MGFNVGKLFNSLTGQSASAKQQANLSLRNQKEILLNQHQWEAQDLEKAGFNPALTLGDISSPGGSAPASGGQGTFNPIDAINSAVSMFTAKKNAETGDTQGQLNLAQAGKLIAETKGIPQQLKNDTIRALASQTQAESQAKLVPSQIAVNETQEEKTKQGRWSELGLKIGKKISNFFEPKTVKNNSGKTVRQHWYGTRKDGR